MFRRHATGDVESAPALFSVGDFSARTLTTGTQAVTGIGFQPKAVIFWGAPGATIAGVMGSGLQQAIGFATGPTEIGSVSGASADASDPSNTARRMAAKAILQASATGSGVVREADLQSFDADGFTLNWTTVAATGATILFLAIGGADVQAKTLIWDVTTSTGNHVVTGAGFTPSAVLHATNNLGSVALPQNSTDMGLGFGAMDVMGNQWMAAVYSQDNLTTTSSRRYQRTDKCLAALSTATNVYEAQYVSMDADGFTVNLTSVLGATRKVASLCLAGLDLKVGSFAKTTDATQVVTGVGFQPSAVLLATTQLAAGTTIQTESSLGLGAGSGGQRRSTHMIDRNAVGIADADAIWKNDAIISMYSTATSMLTAGDLASFNSDGFTITWSATAGSTAQIPYLALR